MKIWIFLYYLVFVILFPVTLPFIIVGAFLRVIHSATSYGYDRMDDLFEVIAKKAKK